MLNEIANYITNNSWFTIDNLDEEEVYATSRTYGNVGDETIGEKDWNEALRLKKEILTKFTNVHVDVDSVDEWVDITIVDKSNLK